jgi:hypothetical protein
MITTIERLSEIENERQQTMSDPNFHAWMKELGVSITYRDPEPVFRAREAMREYNFNKLFARQNIFSIFSI